MKGAVCVSIQKVIYEKEPNNWAVKQSAATGTGMK
jgi:hypothetical protein